MTEEGKKQRDTYKNIRCFFPSTVRQGKPNLPVDTLRCDTWVCPVQPTFPPAVPVNVWSAWP